MKKALILLSLLAMIITTTTGCKKLEVVEIKNQNIDTILASVLEGKQKLYNTSSLGYKFYVPRGMKILTKNQYNTVMKYLNKIPNELIIKEKQGSFCYYKLNLEMADKFE